LSFCQLISSSTTLWEGKSVCKFFVELSIRKANISSLWKTWTAR